MRTMALRIGLLVAVGVGALVARPFLMGGAGDLKVGDCFDVPAGSEAVEDVQHHPCTDPHTGEVFYVGKVAAAEGAPFPSTTALDQQVAPLCLPAFDAYTGLTFETDQTWDMGYFFPLAEDWAKGERGIICYATRLDGAPSSASIKKG